MGYDNRIGSDGLSSDQLSVLCSGTKMPEFVRLEPKMTCSGTKTPDFVRLPAISSTLIRKVLGEGGIEAAQAMLGYRYELYGVVVAGNRMGAAGTGCSGVLTLIFTAKADIKRDGLTGRRLFFNSVLIILQVLLG